MTNKKEKKISRKKHLSRPKKDEIEWFVVEANKWHLPAVLKLASQLESYVHQEDAYTISGFYSSLKMAPQLYYWLVSRWPELKKVHNWAIGFLGNKREVGALTNKLNPQIVTKTLPQYSREYQEQLEWETNLKAKAEAKAQSELYTTREVELPKVTSSIKHKDNDE